MVLKLKNRSPSNTDSPPISWDDLPSSPESSYGLLDIPSPPTTQLPARDMKMFGAQPLRDEYATGKVSCKHCTKPVLRSAFLQHLGELTVGVTFHSLTN
jgi:SAGA-associated factor 73